MKGGGGKQDISHTHSPQHKIPLSELTGFRTVLWCCSCCCAASAAPPWRFGAVSESEMSLWVPELWTWSIPPALAEGLGTPPYWHMHLREEDAHWSVQLTLTTKSHLRHARQQKEFLQEGIQSVACNWRTRDILVFIEEELLHSWADDFTLLQVGTKPKQWKTGVTSAHVMHQTLLQGTIFVNDVSLKAGTGKFKKNPALFQLKI